MTLSKPLASLGFAALLAAASAHAAPVYDLTADFSLTSNPTTGGVWQYGRETVLGGTFSVFQARSAVSGLEFWQQATGTVTTPNVGFNPTAGTISVVSTNFRPGEVTLHPGTGGVLAAVRFTAPAQGIYELGAAFDMRSSGGSRSTDVHVRHNNVEIFTGNASGFGSVTSYHDDEILLQANDILDFLVGPNGDFNGDTTQVNARIEYLRAAVPVPGLQPLLAAGVLGLLTYRRKRRSASLPA